METEQLSPEVVCSSDEQLEVIRVQLELVRRDTEDAIESLDLAQRPTPAFMNLTISIRDDTVDAIESLDLAQRPTPAFINLTISI